MVSEKPYTVIRFTGNNATINQLWHEARNKGVGGSDVAKIMGISSFGTPKDVWDEKTGRVIPEDISDKPAILVGNALEDVVRKWFQRQHPELEVQQVHGMLRSKTRPWAQASLDGRCRVLGTKRNDPANYAVLECKTCSEFRAADWEDGVPDYYLTQVTHYLSVTGWPKAYVVVLIGNREFREFTVERDEQDIAAVDKAVDDFWHLVETNQMPQLTGTDVDRVQEQQPYPEGFEQVEDTDFDQLSALYDSYAQAESDARKSKAKIADRLKQLVGGDREGLVSPHWQVGYRTIHFKEQAARPAKPAYDQRRFYVKQLKENN
ncbi:yqaJ [Bifidobacterium tissieri]|uniref:YqaJ n=1 Tax=Bifidobacterium tissieri TaxID=1630162 RepID=A0A261FFH4_9BIFI|nr:YqaJ viral recombinase family protein [Bifidobacterium tissieri]OZG57828.1 yqaJ [Bifidobacterium tissieri]